MTDHCKNIDRAAGSSHLAPDTEHDGVETFHHISEWARVLLKNAEERRARFAREASE